MTTRTPERMTGYFDPMPKSSINQAKILKWVQEQANTFYRSLSLRGSMQSSDYVAGVSGWRINTDGTAEFNEDVDIGGAGTTNAQLFIHNTLQHINLLENDGTDYPNHQFIIDVNADLGRFLWRDSSGAPVSTEAVRISQNGQFDFVTGPVLHPDGAAATPSITFRASGQQDVGFFRAGTDEIGVTAGATGEVARFSPDAGHNLQGLAWTTWTPTLTNLNIGSTGTMVAGYVRMGAIVWFDIHVTLGGAGISVGDCTFTVPVAEHAEYNAGGDDRVVVGVATLIDAATGVYDAVTTIDDGVLRPRSLNASATHSVQNSLSSTSPFTWVATDRMHLHGWYRAA